MYIGYILHVVNRFSVTHCASEHKSETGSNIFFSASRCTPSIAGKAEGT